MESFKEIGQQRSHVADVLSQRQSLVGKIGTGNVTPQSSVENAIKVGGTRANVNSSIERLEEKAARLDQELEARAPEYLGLLAVQKDQVDRLNGLVEQGFLKKEEVQPHIDDYNAFAALPEQQPALKRGIEKIKEAENAQAQGGSESIDNVVLSEEASFLQIPRVPELAWTESSNEHRYDRSITVGAKESEASSTPESERTPEQKQLLEDIRLFNAYSSSERYKSVFTPEELHGLVEKFKILQQKNRPDFSGLEDRIIDFLHKEIEQARREGRLDSKLDSISGIVKRADQDKANRKGMNWETLNRVAAVASNRLREQNDSRTIFDEYYVPVKDPNENVTLDLGSVFQFAADDYVIKMIGSRIDKVTGVRQAAYRANADTINDWYKDAEGFIAQIPDDLKISDGPVNVRAKYTLKTLIETMNTRLTSTELAGYKKNYKADPVGALNLQKRIAYTVDNINRLLSAPSREEEIVPVEA